MKGVVKIMAIGIGIEKMVDRNYYHLEVLNRMRVSILEYNFVAHNIEYEINDGKIVAEITNVK